MTDDIQIETLTIPKGSVIVLKYRYADVTIEMVQSNYEFFRKEFPENKIVALPDTMSLSIYPKETLKDFRDEICAIIDDLIIGEEYVN